MLRSDLVRGLVRHQRLARRTLGSTIMLPSAVRFRLSGGFRWRSGGQWLPKGRWSFAILGQKLRSNSPNVVHPATTRRWYRRSSHSIFTAIWSDILDAAVLHRQAQTKIIENVQVLLTFGGYDPEPEQHGNVSGRLILAEHPSIRIWMENRNRTNELNRCKEYSKSYTQTTKVVKIYCKCGDEIESLD